MTLTVMVSIAGVDAVYHAQHVEFRPVEDHPLRLDFVENIHTNGQQRCREWNDIVDRSA